MSKTQTNQRSVRWALLSVVALLVAVGLGLETSGARAQSHEAHDHDHDEAASKRTEQHDPDRLWCREHSVYEDECFLCHPELKVKKGSTNATQRAHDSHGHDHGGDGDAGLWCPEHRLPEVKCGICQPQIAESLTPGEGLGIRLPSVNSATKAGIQVSRPRIAESSAGLQVYCEVTYDLNNLARITPLASGVIDRMHADIGDTVEAGALLIEIASAEVAAAKRDLLVATIHERVKRLGFEREAQLLKKEISAEQDYQQAEAEFLMAELKTTTARQKLMDYGFTRPEVAEIEKNKSSSSIVHVHAPFSGTLVERSAVRGEAVHPGSPLFTLADLSTMWLNLAIPEAQAGLLKIGLPVEATFSALPGVVVRGEIRWINTAVTEPSRMVEARAVVNNTDRRLRSNQFGQARIVLSESGTSLTIPKNAVQQFAQRPFIFVKMEEDLYELRRVEIGITHQSRVQVVRGLERDEMVVATGSATMMSEFLKSRLGAGCVHD